MPMCVQTAAFPQLWRTWVDSANTTPMTKYFFDGQREKPILVPAVACRRASTQLAGIVRVFRY